MPVCASTTANKNAMVACEDQPPRSGLVQQNLLGMSKRGDSYLRTLLIHGARSAIYHAGQKTDQNQTCKWINAIVIRRNKNVAAVALANKNARIVWALLTHDREFRPDYTRHTVGV